MKMSMAKAANMMVGMLMLLATGVAAAADKPNILVIFGDDIGMYNISAYHRGMMGGSEGD